MNKCTTCKHLQERDLGRYGVSRPRLCCDRIESSDTVEGKPGESVCLSAFDEERITLQILRPDFFGCVLWEEFKV